MSFNFDQDYSFTGFTPQTPADGCTQCGIILSCCPTFSKSEDPQQSPMGRIRLMRALDGGSHMLSHAHMADALRDDILEQVRSSAADMLISSNLGCAMHLRQGMAQAGMIIPLKHPLQLISDAIATGK